MECIRGKREKITLLNEIKLDIILLELNLFISFVQGCTKHLFTIYFFQKRFQNVKTFKIQEKELELASNKQIKYAMFKQTTLPS